MRSQIVTASASPFTIFVIFVIFLTFVVTP